MSILVCTPCYAGGVTAQHMAAALKLTWALDAAGLEYDWNLGWNESLVHRARMEMTRQFLTTKFSHQLWLDADIDFEPEAVAALWNLNADIAVGVYQMKKPDVKWFTAWKDGKLVNVDEFDGPTEVDYAGTGFMLISRKAIEKIIRHLDRKYEIATRLIDSLGVLDKESKAIAREMLDAMAPDFQGPEGRTPALYKTPLFHDGLESEDYHFCRIAREAGLKIMMDPNVRLTHWGQYPYGAVTQQRNGKAVA